MLLEMQVQPQGLARERLLGMVFPVDGLAHKGNPVLHLLRLLGPVFVREVVIEVVLLEKVAGDIGQAGCTGLFAFAGYVEDDGETGVGACIVAFDVFDGVDEVDAMGLSAPLAAVYSSTAREVCYIPEELNQDGDGGALFGPWGGVEGDATFLLVEYIHCDSSG